MSIQVHNRFHVSKPTDNQVDKILEWLREESANGAEDGFWNNNKVIAQSHETGSLLVAIEKSSSLPVGFLCFDQINAIINILNVKLDYRKQGVGRLLADHIIRESIDSGFPGLLIDRNPSSSIPFWNNLGFRELPLPEALSSQCSEGNCCAIKYFDIPMKVDFEEIRHQIEVRIETTSGTILATHNIGARRDWKNDNRINFERRLVFYASDCNLYIQYLMNEKSLLDRVKLKYSGSQLNSTNSFWWADHLIANLD